MKKEIEKTIHIPLLNEGIDVWRPVKAINIGKNIFKISSENDHEDEEWKFNHGEKVKCIYKELSGTKCLIATEKFI